MPRNPVLGGVARDAGRSISSVVWLSLLGASALAFWVAVIWVAQAVLRFFFAS